MSARTQLRLPRASIARIFLPSLCLIPASIVFGTEPNTNLDDNATFFNKTLPKLENTNELDRLLSREVKDTFVFGPAPAQHSVLDSGNELPAALNAENSGTSKTNQAAITLDSKSSDPLAIDGFENDPLSQPTASWQPVFDSEADSANSVWNKIVKSDRLPLKSNDRVEFYEDQYRRESLWISKILHRGSPFLAHLVSTLDQRFMPVELALLPAIESGYQTNAKSTENATGLWQIVPITAKEIGITRDAWFDGRGDILKSTTAAIDYLSYLNATFDGDWELTLAAYNAGPGRVRSAIKKNAAAGLPTDYWSLDLPRETMNYVPKLIALVSLVKQPGQGGFDMPDVRMEPAFESIDVGFRVSLDKVAKITNISEAVLRSLNAGLIHGVTAPNGPHHLLIPAGTGEIFQQAFAGLDRSNAFSEPKTHKVTAGDTISSIALKYGLTQRALLSMNGLDNANIRIGQKLAVLDSRSTSESTVKYVVSIGDTLSEIAYKFSVNVQDIRLSTGEALDGDIIHPGTTLNIIVDLPSAG